MENNISIYKELKTEDRSDGNYVVRLHLKCLTWFQRIRLVICDESLFDESLCDVPLFDAS